MSQLNITPDEILHFIQNVQPAFLYKWILLFFAFGFIVFHIVVFNQIQSMDKVISQPSSTTILSTVSLIFIIAGIGITVFVFLIPV